MADQLWYFAHNKQKVGPLALPHLRRLIVAGQLQPGDMVLPAGGTKWVQASTVDGLFPLAIAVPAPAPLPVESVAMRGPKQYEVVPEARSRPLPVSRSVRLPIGISCTLLIGLVVGVAFWVRGGNRTDPGTASAQSAPDTAPGSEPNKNPPAQNADAPTSATDVVVEGKPLSTWIAQLNDKDAKQGDQARETLVRSERAAVPALLEALNGKDRYLSVQAILILGQIGPAAKSAAPALKDARKYTDPDTRRIAAVALARVSPDEINTSATMLLDLMRAEYDPWMPSKERQNAELASADLAQLGRPAVPFLVEAFRDPNPILRRKVAVTLGKMGSDAREAVPALVKNLDDKDAVVRVAVAASLARMSPEHLQRSIDVLIAAVKNSEDSAFLGRYAAITALGNLGPLAKPAVPALSSLVWQGFGDPLERAAKAALEKIRAEPTEKAVEARNVWDDILDQKQTDGVNSLATSITAQRLRAIGEKEGFTVEDQKRDMVKFKSDLVTVYFFVPDKGTRVLAILPLHRTKATAKRVNAFNDKPSTYFTAVLGNNGDAYFKGSLDLEGGISEKAVGRFVAAFMKAAPQFVLEVCAEE